MTNKPLVSIIIPTYNRADLISETLDSIIAQTYTNWECIVVDDGSTDNTEEILLFYMQKDYRITYHQRPSKYKPGGNGARNYGFDISKGEYINWFDSDDIMHPEKISLQMEKLLNSDYKFTICNTYVFENNIKDNLVVRSEKIHSSNNFMDYLTQKNAFLTNAIIWKKSFLKKNRYNEDLKAAQEWEFNSLILAKEPNYSFIEKCLVYNRKHSSSISYSIEKKQERIINYVKARKFVYKYIENRKDLSKEKEYLLNFIKIYTENYMKSRDFKSLNDIIFFDGINTQTLTSFFTIYFFIYTNRLKSKIKYV